MTRGRGLRRRDGVERRRPWRCGIEVDGAELERLGLVEARELEQVLDEAAHADGLLLDAFHGLGDVLGGLQGAHAVELGVAAHRDQGRAQLVAGVADEAAHLARWSCAVGEGAVDAAEHGVERAVEAADLGVGGRDRRGAG